MAKIVSVVLTVSIALNSPMAATACDISFPARGSVVSWPKFLFAAKVKTLRVREVSEFDRYAWVRVVEPLVGNLPREFGVIYDTSSCGAYFQTGQTQVAGFIALPSKEWKGDYHFLSKLIAGTWAHAVFVSGRLTLGR